jgi:hypothetical protein
MEGGTAVSREELEPVDNHREERPTYLLELRPERGVDGDYALKRLLKAALRQFGLRCIAYRKRRP